MISLISNGGPPMKKKYLFLITISITMLFLMPGLFSDISRKSDIKVDEVGPVQEDKSDPMGEKRGTLHPFSGGWVAITSGGVERYYDRTPRRDQQHTSAWYYNDAISKNGNIPTYQQMIDWMQNWGCQNVGGSADMTYLNRENPLDLRWTDRPCCSCEGDITENSPPRTSGNGGIIYGWDTLYATCIMSEAAELRTDEGDDLVCYARYKPYTLRVKVNTIDDLNDAEEVKVYLDYNTTNASFCYNWGNETFYKMQDPDNHVELLVNECEISNDNSEFWFLDFTFIIDFAFPHEELVDCFIDTQAKNGDDSRDFFPWLFRVEKDVSFSGFPLAEGEFQGSLLENRWVRGNEGIRFDNLTVNYQGAPEKFLKMITSMLRSPTPWATLGGTMYLQVSLWSLMWRQ